MSKESKIGIFVLVVFVIFGYFVIKTDSLITLLSRGKTYTVYARFHSVSGLFESAPVRLAGVRIGTVVNIALVGNKAVITMLIKEEYSLTTDGRATISSMGIVGENFIEIVYNDEFKTDSPEVIQPEGEIRTTTSFGLETFGNEFKVVSPKIRKMLDSVNAVIADSKWQNSLKATMDNMKDISANLKKMSGNEGKVYRTVGSIDTAAVELKKTLDSLNKFIGNLDKSLYKQDKGIVKNIGEVSDRLKAITEDLQKIVKQVNRGEGTAGKLLKDDGLYKKLDSSLESANTLIKDLGRKVKSLDNTKMNYYAGVDYSTDDKRARFNLGMNLNFSKLSLYTRVREDAMEGDPYFTVMAGKRYKYFTVAAGMVDSGLGAALYLNLFDRRVNLQMEASRFYRDSSPLLRAVVSFSLNKNINLTAGYEDLFEKNNRRFMVGIAFTN